ncbi:hypothetical protein BSKO_01700 [Bryopsis sp. KO-2023]|nr:hypothetical protein BSKO_01700 [Bryopsis sp. KO-2023]
MEEERGAHILDDAKVTQLQAVSKKTLHRLTESKNALREFNDFSAKELLEARGKLHNHAQVLVELKNDLMHVYGQIRVIRKLIPRVEELKERRE